ncbi:alpha/beta fold hydrolase [Amycolatopsis sp. cg5]|uniref:alpha/beta fold hydrolase n=1 Tax=Amycolatopsis sp. cg5 TaxID=3238802 RepID=UPI0035248323
MDDVVYTRAGQGEPLVLIHGVGHRRQAWDPVIPLLAKHRDVIAVDLPGFGDSPPRDDAYGVEPALRLFREFFAGLGLGRPHVAGNSLGGLLSLALGQAGLVRSVTALSPAGLWTYAQQRYAIGMLRTHYHLARRIPDRFGRRLAASAVGRTVVSGMIFDKPARVAPEVIFDDMRAFGSAAGFIPTVALTRGRGFRFEGPVLDVPVTIAWSQRDRILARPRAAELRKMCPQAQLLVLPGCGHVPMSDDPELVTRVLLEGSDV